MLAWSRAKPRRVKARRVSMSVLRSASNLLSLSRIRTAPLESTDTCLSSFCVEFSTSCSLDVHLEISRWWSLFSSYIALAKSQRRSLGSSLPSILKPASFVCCLFNLSARSGWASFFTGMSSTLSTELRSSAAVNPYASWNSLLKVASSPTVGSRPIAACMAATNGASSLLPGTYEELKANFASVLTPLTHSASRISLAIPSEVALALN